MPSQARPLGGGGSWATETRVGLAWVTPSIVPGTAINVAASTRKRKRGAGSTQWRKCSVTLCFLFLMRTHIGTRPCKDGLKDKDKEESNFNNQYLTATSLRFC